MNRLPLIAGLLVSCAALAQNAPQQPQQQPQEQPQQQQLAEKPQERPSVEVIDPGAEPREEIRYQPTIGQAERVELAMNLSLTTIVGGQENPAMELPTVTSIWRQTPRQIENGEIQYDIQYESVKVDPSDPIAAQLEPLFAPLSSITGVGAITDRGEQVQLELNPPAQANQVAASQIEMMRTQMQGLGVIFPEEAIGEGASWTVTSPLEIDGVQVEQKTSYTLQSRENGTVRLAMAVDQTAPRQTLSAPGLPPDAATVESFSGDGEGEIELDPKRLAPSQSSSSNSITVDIRLDTGEAPQEVTQKRTSRIEASSRPAEEGAQEGSEGGADDQPAPEGNVPGGG